MAVQIQDNFQYRGPKPNFVRDAFDTLEEMANASPGEMDGGHLCYCKEDGKTYRYRKYTEGGQEKGEFEPFEFPEIISAGSFLE